MYHQTRERAFVSHNCYALDVLQMKVQSLQKGSQTDRLVYLDFAKGIGIILVVWAHALGPFSDYINSFHMPYFFFISGMLYKGDRNITRYAKSKVKSLLLPFWVYNLMVYPVFFVLHYWKQWSAVVFIRDIIEIIITIDKSPFLGATWFLASLFWISVIIHAVYRFMHKHNICDFWLLAGGIVTLITGLEITFPYRISRTLICSGFYVFGYIYNKYVSKHIAGPVKFIVAIVMLVISLVLANKFPASLSTNEYDNKVTFVLGALCALLFFIYLSRQLAVLNNNMLVQHICYLGKESLNIVIWQFLTFRFAIIIQILLLNISITSLTAFPVYDTSGIWFLIYLIAGIYGSIVVGKLTNQLVLNNIKIVAK